MKGYRTFAFNGVMMFITFAAELMVAIGQDPAIAALLPEGWMTYVLIATLIGNVILRTITTTAPFDNGAPKDADF